MSSGATRLPHERRPSAHPDEKARYRMSAQSSFKGDRADSRQGPSPQQQYQQTSHKRSASGKPRPMAHAPEERMTEEKRTERTYVTHREMLATRTRSPERQERAEKRESRSRPAAEPRETKPEPAPQGKQAHERSTTT